MANTMKINGLTVEIHDEKNVLELIRKVGIEMPTLCYQPSLSIYGACRLCMVETSKGALDAACSMAPRAGMEIYTNTRRLRKYRKGILELLMANHERDCTACEKNGNCKLQELCYLYGLRDIRFENLAPNPEEDRSSPSIVRNAHKCILCGACVRMCDEIQGVGAIYYTSRSSKVKITTAFDRPLSESPCVGCGQCASVCPTGAITIVNDIGRIWRAIDDKNIRVSAQVAPAVRVAIGRELGLGDDKDAMGRIVAALRALGFDEVYDTSTTADLTVLEEANEFVQKLQSGNTQMPLFTSCCPGWIQYAEKRYPELLPYISTCRSPMQMFASILHQTHKDGEKKHFHVAIMPCTAKKFEAKRDEFKLDGEDPVDAVITTKELIDMIRGSGIVFKELTPEAVDMPFSLATGAGVIFGVTGGVTEAVLRYVSADKSKTALDAIAYTGVRGLEGVKETTVPFGDGELKIAVVSGLGNTGKLIEKIKAGEVKYDFVEVMACPGGCINGAGQPYNDKPKTVENRSKALYGADKMFSLRSSEMNPLMSELYDGVLKDKVHELLHVHYGHKD